LGGQNPEMLSFGCLVGLLRRSFDVQRAGGGGECVRSRKGWDVVTIILNSSN
jgi:hypothetical protein